MGFLYSILESFLPVLMRIFRSRTEYLLNKVFNGEFDCRIEVAHEVPYGLKLIGRT